MNCSAVEAKPDVSRQASSRCWLGRHARGLTRKLPLASSRKRPRAPAVGGRADGREAARRITRPFVQQFQARRPPRYQGSGRSTQACCVPGAAALRGDSSCADSSIASPKANAICERLIGTIRRECLDWMIPVSEAHLRSILRAWRTHYNRGRPHSFGSRRPGASAATFLDSEVSDPASTVGGCARARQVGAGRFASRVRAHADAGERVVGQPPSWPERNLATA